MQALSTESFSDYDVLYNSVLRRHAESIVPSHQSIEELIWFDWTSIGSYGWFERIPVQTKGLGLILIFLFLLSSLLVSSACVSSLVTYWHPDQHHHHHQPTHHQYDQHESQYWLLKTILTDSNTPAVPASKVSSVASTLIPLPVAASVWVSRHLGGWCSKNCLWL